MSLHTKPHCSNHSENDIVFLYIYFFYTRHWDIGKIFLMRHKENPAFEIAGKSYLRDMWKILLMRYKIFLMRHVENPTFEISGKSYLRDVWKILLMRYRRLCEMLGNPTYETWGNYAYEIWGKIILMRHNIIIDTKCEHKRQTDSNTGLADNLISKAMDR